MTRLIRSQRRSRKETFWFGPDSATRYHTFEKQYSSAPLPVCSTTSPTLTINCKVFDVLEKQSKDYYALFISAKAKYPNYFQSLKREFKLTDVQLEEVFILLHTMCFESFVKAFQYKVLNNTLNTNTKLHKLGFTADHRCSFCIFEHETLEHLLFYCTHSKRVWKDFESYFHSLMFQPMRVSETTTVCGIKG